MKRYIFIIPSICNIGGAQLYLVNKMHYLKEKGWDVNVIYARKDIILIKELTQFEANSYPYLDYSIMYYRKSFVVQKVKEICCKLGDSKYLETVIESCTVSISTWAELIAKELKCKHIIFAFEELFDMSKSQLDFAYFKHIRHELAGIKPESVPMMFKNSEYRISTPEYYRACPMPSIGKVADNWTEILKSYDVVIGSFGRLNKGFVWEAMKEIYKYMSLHKGPRYALLLVGDTKDERFKQMIRNKFNNIADVIITGEVCPASLDMMKSVNVFVSSSGAAVITSALGIPTIAVSPESFLPNGILDYTTDSSLFVKDPSFKSISELIEDVIDNEYCSTHPKMGIYENYFENMHNNHWAEFDRQVTIALDCIAPQEYYDVFKISLEGKRKWAGIYCKIFGYDFFAKTIAFTSKHLGTLIKG